MQTRSRLFRQIVRNYAGIPAYFNEFLAKTAENIRGVAINKAKGNRAMDHYNEQLIRKLSEPKDIFLRILICCLTTVVIFICVGAMILFGFPMLLIIAAGACYLAYLLLSGTFTEYEYIVTNNDLDIDKISGKRKRKRLITVKLNTVKSWGEYTGKSDPGANATVMASDATGRNIWYLDAEHEKYGKVTVLFTPSAETVYNINFGVPHSVRKKLETAEERQEKETTDNA